LFFGNRESLRYYWAREAPNSNAEVDYLVANNDTALPVEIKVGATGSFRSMHLFLQHYHRPFGIAVSQKPYQPQAPVVSIQLYALQYWRNLIPQCQTCND
jgi:hypothetical protein